MNVPSIYINGDMVLSATEKAIASLTSQLHSEVLTIARVLNNEHNAFFNSRKKAKELNAALAATLEDASGFTITNRYSFENTREIFLKCSNVCEIGTWKHFISIDRLIFKIQTLYEVNQAAAAQISLTERGPDNKITFIPQVQITYQMLDLFYRELMEHITRKNLL